MNELVNQLNQRAWERDIEAFTYYKKRFLGAEYTNTKKLLHKWMCEVQAKWPQFIKKSEIPDLEASL